MFNRIAPSILWLAFVFSGPAMQLQAEQPNSLKNDDVVTMVKWKQTDTEIIATINRNDGVEFELTPATIKSLKDAGVSEAVLDAMFTATKKSSATGPTSTSPTSTPPVLTATTVSTTPTSTTTTVSTTTTTSTTATGAKPTSTSTSTKTIPAHSPERFDQAIGTKAETVIPLLPSQCSPGNNGKVPTRKISLFWPSGTSDPTRMYESGPVCFEVRDFNNILYIASFTVTETAPTGSALDLLKDAISTVTSFSFGAKAPTATQAQNKSECPAALEDSVTTALGAAAQFSDAISQLDPGKDSTGKVNLVDWQTTVAKWQPVPPLYNQFQAAVSQVINNLSLPKISACPDVLAAAEAVIIDAYIPARETYRMYQSRVDSDHVLRFSASTISTSDYKVTVQANYPAGAVANGTKDFLIPAGHKILSSSGGFLITEVPARTYSSVTVPSGMQNPATQNVLGIDYYNGPRVGLTALLNVYLPSVGPIRLNGQNWGFALSAGPTYAVSGNSADTSHWGFFAGPSLHIRNQFFLTPGVNIGEFADFPLGYTHAGQLIPPGTGTPTPVKRYTARFAFAITYKIKDFGQTTTQTNATSTTANTDGSKTGSGSSNSTTKKP